VICDSSISSGEHVMMDANDRHLFLKGKSPAVLYLWEKANEHNLLNTVCQQLSDEAAFDSAVDTAALTISTRKDKNRKRDNEKSDEENRAESNAIIDALNLSNHIAAEDQRMKKKEMLGEKQNEIDDIEDKLEDTFLIASSNKRIRLQKKLDRIKKEVVILEKEIGSVEEE